MSEATIGIRPEMGRADADTARWANVVRASLIDAYIASRKLTGVTVTSADEVAALDLMFHKLTTYRIAPEAQ